MEEEYKIKYEDLIGTYEQKRAVVAKFNLMDDIFFSVVLDHKDAAEYLISKLLNKKIKVVKSKTQYSIRNIEMRSIILDALIQDNKGRLYNAEVQIGNKENHERRLRSYQAGIDFSVLKKRKDFSKLADLYMLFISDFDPFELKKVHYEVESRIKGTKKIYNNGIHIHYFNTAVSDGTFLSELLQYLKHSDPNNGKFGALSKQVKNYKVKNEGVDSMCKMVEEFAREREERGEIIGKIKTVKNMLKEKIPFETALRCAQIDMETYEKYAEQL